MADSDAGVLLILLPILATLLFYLLPFFINAALAKSRGKSVILTLLLTFIFSWLVTLILAFIPKEKKNLQIDRDYHEDDFRMS